MDNVIATLLKHGNGAHTVDLDRIAHHQRFDAAEFRARFAHIQTTFSLTPVGDEWEGK